VSSVQRTKLVIKIMATQDEFVRITVRLPPGLHEALEALAREQNTSINSKIVAMLNDKVSAELNKEVDGHNLTLLQIPFFAMQLAERAQKRAANAMSESDREKYTEVASLLEAMALRVEDQVLADPPV
jgi:hypothetical protein